MRVQCLNCFEHYEQAGTPCPHCGYVQGAHAAEALHMDPGSVLQNRYHIGKVLGFGGFGVTYLAFDEVLQMKVAIKEYLPSEFSTRSPGITEITVFNGNKEQQFQDGLERFVAEAKRLAKFQNEPGIVGIFDSFMENNTAYIVMEYLEGITLTKYLEQQGKLDPEIAIGLLTPVMKSLERVHQEGIIHRDIAPDNIMITKSGEVKLIDFGAARYATTSHSRSLTVIIKPGYSPEEQYRSRGDQGPHTDVYAMAAVLYRVITGVTPPDALERRAYFENGKKDILEEPSRYVKKLDTNTETAILNAMNVRVEDRTAMMRQFFDELTSEKPVKRRVGKIKKIDVLKWPLWAKIAAPVGTLAVAVVLVLFFTGVIGFNANLQTEMSIPEGMTRVPSVINESEEDAETRIVEASLVAQIIDKQSNNYVAENMVLTQSISGGRVTDQGDTLGLVISAGPEKVEVPSVVGQTKETAIQQLEELGFQVEVQEAYSTTAAGSICEQSATEEELTYGSVITLTVSLGLENVDTTKETEVPDVSGMTYEEAAEVLAEYGLTLAKGESVYSTEVEAGKIIEQDLKAGTTVKQGETVTVVISLGIETVKVSDVQYKDKSEAQKTLEDLGLKVTFKYEDSDTVAKDRVIRQSVKSGEKVEPGTEVILYISNGNDNAKDVAQIEQDYQEDLEWQKTTTAATAKKNNTGTTDKKTNDQKTNDQQTSTEAVAEESSLGQNTAVSAKTETTKAAETATKATSAQTAQTTKAKESTRAAETTKAKETTKAAETTKAQETSKAKEKETTRAAETTKAIESTKEANIVALGGCGDNATWKLDEEGILSISGTGDLYTGGYYYTYDGTVFYSFWSEYESEIKKIIINDGISNISDMAFSECTNLTEVIIPNSVRSIGMYAFYDCKGLETLNLPEQLTSIGTNALAGCNIKYIYLPGYITSFGNGIFGSNNCSLEQAKVGEGVTYLWDKAFNNCTNLTTVELPESISIIGDMAFGYCESLVMVDLPESVTEIELGAFYGCINLENISIPSGVTSIGSNAFYNCCSLTSVWLPDNLTDLGWDVFSGCTSLKEVNIPKNIKNIPSGMFGNCSSLTNITISDNIEKIEEAAFFRCESLTDIYIPQSVTSMEKGVFRGWTASQTIYVQEYTSAPSGWSEDWNDQCEATIIWGW